LAVDDVVVSPGSLGAFRPVANVPAASLFKVPVGLPAEYASVLDAPCTAAALLKGVKAGEVVVQSGADTLVGHAVVQLAKAKGVRTINVVKTSPDEAEMVDLLKSLGGDVVAPGFYALSPKFHALVADMPKPVLAITYAGPLDDASLAAKVAAAGSAVSKLRPLVAAASASDLAALKVQATVASLASATASHGPLAPAAVAWGADEVAEVTNMIKAEDLALWVEKYPLVDLEYASKKATERYPGFRAMVLNF
jgi:NADPH:quinone reductase-like Zn-dependent oxidoreductase